MVKKRLDKYYVGGFPMSDFIPGEAYRLDIVGADESVLVDSWTSQIKASVVARDGSLLVDVDTGKIYGPFVGDVQDLEGEIILNSSTRTLTGTLNGNLIDEVGSIVVDVSLGVVNANLNGSVYDSSGTLIIDASSRTINAEAIYGTFYGDLIGTISSENTMFGTFSGDFNGNHYGDFYGEFNGTLTGDVVGNLTGVVTGGLIGEIMADANTSLIGHPNEEFNQHNWLGGIGHPAAVAETDVAKGPIVVLGETRADSHVIAHLNNYDGRPVVHLDQIGNSPWPAHHFGKFRGELYSNDDKALLTYNANNGQVYVKSYGILTLEANNGNSALDFIGDTATFNVKGPQTVRSFNGTWENKTALLPDEAIIQFDAEGFDGSGWRQGGGFGIYIADEPINSTAYKTYFGVALSDGVNEPAANENKGLIFDSAGILRTPVTKLGGTTFAQRDSMSPEAGMIIFNSSNKKFQGYNGTAWVDLG